jgi:hypothetical protein
MMRREFITLLGGAAVAWPLTADAQQSPVRPLIGVLSPLSAAAATRNIAAFRSGLRDLGYRRPITLDTLQGKDRVADGPPFLLAFSATVICPVVFENRCKTPVFSIRFDSFTFRQFLAELRRPMPRSDMHDARPSPATGL